MAHSRSWVLAACGLDRPVYGVNTGFGSLARVRIDPQNSATLSTTSSAATPRASVPPSASPSAGP